MSAIPEAISKRMRKVLEGSVENIVPGSKILVKKHVWRNPDYVGMSSNKVAVWQGWSANLAKLDSRYKTLYIDYVDTVGSKTENEQLFGAVFSSAIATIQPFIFLFVTACPLAKQSEVISQGYTFRQINNIIHPGMVIDLESFLVTNLEDWAKIGKELLYLQHRIRN